ncbi:DUF305 domain-containing protein [Methylobacterium sp. E-065]|uniref:DUF305 domain-containing protein n=1 Tax=Methylobacterium sp. E-065 TaxID=2836583 RepID=UPI001FBA9B55|nr:DUF305 domain-containing protein [Methylobacterium sp. E-065]MCJ2019791.1 DUF305 domain-containing protein [Methylobacterium sp. E-065]
MRLGLLPTAGSAVAEGSLPHAHGHAQSAVRTGTEADTPATRGFTAALSQMMHDMAVPYTGDPDVDFRLQMIPHHRRAIAMGQVARAHAKDPWTRQLAEAVIVEQQREIAEMEAWLGQRGVAVPPDGGPQHVQTAESYRSRDPEAGPARKYADNPGPPGRVSGRPARRRSGCRRATRSATQGHRVSGSGFTDGRSS